MTGGRGRTPFDRRAIQATSSSLLLLLLTSASLLRCCHFLCLTAPRMGLPPDVRAELRKMPAVATSSSTSVNTRHACGRPGA